MEILPHGGPGFQWPPKSNQRFYPQVRLLKSAQQCDSDVARVLLGVNSAMSKNFSTDKAEAVGSLTVGCQAPDNDRVPAMLTSFLVVSFRLP